MGGGDALIWFERGQDNLDAWKMLEASGVHKTPHEPGGLGNKVEANALADYADTVPTRGNHVRSRMGYRMANCFYCHMQRP